MTDYTFAIKDKIMELKASSTFILDYVILL